jgi:hypothetical protein
LTSLGVADIFIFKLDVSGNFVWAKLLSGTSINYYYSIGIVVPGNLYITGSFAGTVDFDPGPGIYNLTSIGNGDIFIASLDSSGNFGWAAAMGGGDSDYGNSIAVDFLGNVYTTGGFEGIVDFDPGTGIFNLTSVGVDIFTHKMSYITGIEELSSAGIYVYPNPTNDKITIRSDSKEIGEMKIFDIVGKLIKYELINERNAEIDVLEIKPGLYFLELRNQRIKIIKQ